MMGGITRDVLNRLGCLKKDIFDTLEKVIVFEEIGINKERLELLKSSIQALANDVDYMLQRYEQIEHRETDGDNRGVQSRFERKQD